MKMQSQTKKLKNKRQLKIRMWLLLMIANQQQMNSKNQKMQWRFVNKSDRPVYLLVQLVSYLFVKSREPD